MKNVEFKQSEDFTVGTELELFIIDPNTRIPVGRCSDLLKELNDSPNIKHEFYEAEVEINSNKCRTISELEKDLAKHVRVLHEAATKLGLKLVMAGTHPMGFWSEQQLSPSKRYLNLAKNIKMPMYRMLASGIHVHVGLRSGPEAVAVNNGIMNYLPHLLALSCSSPYWGKRDSGMESYRVKIIETLPVTGLPYQMSGWEEFCELFCVLKKAGTIETIREIWWDTRPHPDFGTVEVRICDATPLYKDVVSIAALVQSLMAYFAKKFRTGEDIDTLPAFIIRQNKWRAARYGLDGEFIVDRAGNTSPIKSEIEKLIKELQPISKELNSDKYLTQIKSILKRGTSSKRQRKVFEESKGSWNAVIDSLVNEFEESWQLTKTGVRR